MRVKMKMKVSYNYLSDFIYFTWFNYLSDVRINY